MSSCADQYSFFKTRVVFGSHQALQIEELRIAAERITCILGPTGAGKSTLLRLCCGTLAPTEGKIDWETTGRMPFQLSLPERRRMAAGYQQPILLRRSVLSNVVYPLKLRCYCWMSLPATSIRLP